jgi:hypothetical protein
MVLQKVHFWVYLSSSSSLILRPLVKMVQLHTLQVKFLNVFHALRNRPSYNKSVHFIQSNINQKNRIFPSSDLVRELNLCDFTCIYRIDRIIPQGHARPHTASSKKLIEYYSNSILINQEFGNFQYLACFFYFDSRD